MRKCRAGLDDALLSNEIELGEEILHYSADMLIDLDSGEEHINPRVTRSVSYSTVLKGQAGPFLYFLTVDFSSVVALHWCLAWL